MRPSKGVHIVVPRDRIDASVALITKTATSVLFVLPWGRSWIIGTTDTDVAPRALAPVGHPRRPRPTCSTWPTPRSPSNLTESDVIGLYAGLRPLRRHRGPLASRRSPASTPCATRCPGSSRSPAASTRPTA